MTDATAIITNRKVDAIWTHGAFVTDGSCKTLSLGLERTGVASHLVCRVHCESNAYGFASSE